MDTVWYKGEVALEQFVGGSIFVRTKDREQWEHTTVYFAKRQHQHVYPQIAGTISCLRRAPAELASPLCRA